MTWDLTQRVLEVTRAQVETIYKTGIFADEWTKFEITTTNGTHSWNGNLRGWSHEKGYCGGESIQLYGLTYPDSVLAAQYDFVLRDGLVTVDLERDTVRIFSGESCKYSKKHCVSLTYGDIYWETVDSDNNCNPETYPVLYDGAAVLNNYPENAVTEGKQIVTAKSESQAFSLVLTEKKMLCSQLAFATEHPKLFVVIIPPHGLRYFKKSTMHPLDINIDRYRDSKLIYIEKHMQRELTELNAHAMSQICKIELQVLANLKAAAVIEPSQFGYAYKKEPGYTAVVRGEVIYLITCVPVRVFLRSTDACFQELPVSYLNNSYFLNPRTRILTHWSEQVECSTLFPVKFKIHQDWYSVVPTFVKSTPPQKISTGTNFSMWKYEHVDMKLGIYTPKDIERQRAAVLFPLEYTPITRTIAANAGGYTTHNQGLNMFSMINTNQLKQAVANYWDEFSGLFKAFGAYSGGIIMIMVIYKTMAHVCHGGVHCMAISKIFGGMVGLLAFVCPNLASLALIYGREDIKSTGNPRATLRGAFREFRNDQKLNDDQKIVDIEIGPAEQGDGAREMYPITDLTQLRFQEGRLVERKLEVNEPYNNKK